MIKKHPDLPLSSVCEIGCGAGGVLAELQRLLPETTSFTGYEISPQAHIISKIFENDRCQYILGDAFANPIINDLALVIDVVEHVEDCFSFMRRVKHKSKFALYHIPIDAHASSMLRGVTCWDSLGHLHLFTEHTALRTIEQAGYHIIDWCLTDGAVQRPRSLKTRLVNSLRRPVAHFSPRLAARTLGGYSILILAQ
jgi:SAM-dependent methyltransferase